MGIRSSVLYRSTLRSCSMTTFAISFTNCSCVIHPSLVGLPLKTSDGYYDSTRRMSLSLCLRQKLYHVVVRSRDYVNSDHLADSLCGSASCIYSRLHSSNITAH